MFMTDIISSGKINWDLIKKFRTNFDIFYNEISEKVIIQFFKRILKIKFKTPC